MNKKRKSDAEEKGKRADEQAIADIELVFQSGEKERRASASVLAETELAFQNKEKEKRAAELIIANEDLAKQNAEKEKRKLELTIANKKLALQSVEKAKRSAELIVANKELAFQNEEKEKRSAELILANKELAFESREKQDRASELALANLELIFQQEEKIKRAAELVIAEQFAYVASHDLQEPLRTISDYLQILEMEYAPLLDDNARNYLHVVNSAAKRMRILIKSLLDFSRLELKEINLVDFGKMVSSVMDDLDALIKHSGAIIEVGEMPALNAYETEIRQVFQNLITNAIKFQAQGVQPKIQIRSEKVNEKWKFSISDNGIGIEGAHFKSVFNIFQRLHTKAEYEGSGIGLANCKKIIELHHGEIWIDSVKGQGSTFHFTVPILQPVKDKTK